jgi:hypothetical protein
VLLSLLQSLLLPAVLLSVLLPPVLLRLLRLAVLLSLLLPPVLLRLLLLAVLLSLLLLAPPLGRLQLHPRQQQLRYLSRSCETTGKRITKIQMSIEKNFVQFSFQRRSMHAQKTSRSLVFFSLGERCLLRPWDPRKM